MKKIRSLLLFFALIFCVISAQSQEKQTISGKTVKITMPKKVIVQEPVVKEEVKKEVENKETIIKQEVEDYVNKLLSNNQISKNVQTSVNVSVLNETTATGENELNLHAKYNYEIIGKLPDNLKAQIDDYPSGKYKLGSSNAAKTTMQILKQTIEGNLSEFLTAGTRVTIKITGTTDASPINNTIPYTGDFGDIEDFTYLLNNSVNSLSVKQATGIKSNEQLGFLRTYGVRQFMETYIEPLKQTTNVYEHFVEVASEGGSQSRRVTIELIIHDAFRNYQPQMLSQADSLQVKKELPKSDVDINIPQVTGSKDNVYVVIIGNEDYSSSQTELNSEVNVEFAVNDAKIFKEYCLKTLCVPEKNIFMKTNVTSAPMKKLIAKLAIIAELKGEDAELIFYYSGHGLPDEQTKEGYIMPVDVSGADIQNAIKISDLYSQLTEFPSKRVTVFLDACFSGGGRNKGLVSLKGVKIKPKEELLTGNLVVFTSSSGDESSCVYKEKQHGIFTYYLLQKLQESKGDVTYKQLSDYIIEKVSLENVIINNKKQTPTISGSTSVQNDWETWKLR